jgi:hypothetical protein
MSFVGHLLTPLNNVHFCALDDLVDRLDHYTSRLTKLLKDLEEEIELVEVSEVDELMEEGHTSVIIMMRKDIFLEIVHF